MKKLINNERLTQKIIADSYCRERSDPQACDIYYLALSDLVLFLSRLPESKEKRVLDLGCGGSPYRILFPHSTYQRADYLEAPENPLDFQIGEDSRVNAPDAIFDIVISTQVAEHVRDPDTFFAEIHRLLVPGGVLVCTTHGQWEEHGCPHDYQRWTAAGLIRDVVKAGFVVERCCKLTTNGRAMLSQLIGQADLLYAGKRTILGLLFFLLRLTLKLLRGPLHRAADKVYSDCRVVSHDIARHGFYIGLGIVARKPSMPPPQEDL